MHDTTPAESADPGQRSPAFTVLQVVLGLEFLALAGVTVWLLVELVTSPATSLASGIALTILTAIAALWLGALFVGLRNRRPWVRSGIIVWQVMQGALHVVELTAPLDVVALRKLHLSLDLGLQLFDVAAQVSILHVDAHNDATLAHAPVDERRTFDHLDACHLVKGQTWPIG